MTTADIGVDLSRYQARLERRGGLRLQAQEGPERGDPPGDVLAQGRAPVDARLPAQEPAPVPAAAHARLGWRHLGHRLRRHLLLHQAHRGALRRLGRRTRVDKEHLREARHPRSRAQVPRRRDRSVRVPAGRRPRLHHPSGPGAHQGRAAGRPGLLPQRGDRRDRDPSGQALRPDRCPSDLRGDGRLPLPPHDRRYGQPSCPLPRRQPQARTAAGPLRAALEDDRRAAEREIWSRWARDLPGFGAESRAPRLGGHAGTFPHPDLGRPHVAARSVDRRRPLPERARTPDLSGRARHPRYRDRAAGRGGPGGRRPVRPRPGQERPLATDVQLEGSRRVAGAQRVRGLQRHPAHPGVGVLASRPPSAWRFWAGMSTRTAT